MAAISPSVQSRIDEIERRASQLRSYCDVEVNANTIPWFLWKLKDGGTLAQMHTSGYNFERSQSLEGLGFRLPPAVRRLIRGTKIAVIPPEYSGGFVSAQATAYRAVSGASYDLDLVTIYEGNGVRYVTWNAYGRLEELVEHASKQHEAAKTKLVENQSSARQAMERDLLVVAGESFANLKGKLTAKDLPDETAFKTAIVKDGLDEFDRFMARLDSIGFRLRLKPIILGAEVLAAQAEETELQGQIREEQSARADRIRQRQIKVQEKERLSQMKIAAAQVEIERDADVKERVRRQWLETARADAEGLLNPFRQGMAQLRANVYEDLKMIRDNLQEKGSLAPASAAKLANVLDTFRAMKFTSDEELEELLENVTMTAAGPGWARDRATPQILGMLNQIMSITSEKAVEAITSSGRSERVAF